MTALAGPVVACVFDLAAVREAVDGGRADAAIDRAVTDASPPPPADARGDVLTDPRCPGVDLATDPKNCGRCGHDCLGGACAGGACRPVVLASGLTSPRAITVEGSYVYFTALTPLGASAFRAPTAGGAYQELCTVPGAPAGIATDGIDVYWAAPASGGDGAIWRCPVAGGGPSSVSGNGRDPFAVVLSGAYVFWSNKASGQGSVRIARKDGTNENGQPAAEPLGVASGPAAFYFADYALLQTNISACTSPNLGASCTRIAAMPARATAMAIDPSGATRVLWIGRSTGGVYRCPLPSCFDAGATWGQEAGAPDGFGIAVDDTDLYIASTGLWRMSKVSGALEALPVRGDPVGVAVDALAVYTTTAGGEVLKLAK